MTRLRSLPRFAALVVLFQTVIVYGSFTLHWINNDLSGDETGISIERSDSGAGFVQIATVDPSTTTYQDTTATESITYAYRVRAFNAAGYSGYTNTATNAPTFLAQPPASQSVAASGTVTVVGVGSTLITASQDGNADYQAAAPASQTLIVSSAGVPVVTSGAFPAALNQFFSYAIQATNSPTSFAASGLPPGLSLNPSTGVISGIPTSAGTAIASVSATNAMATGSGDLTITVSKATQTISFLLAAPVLNTPLTLNATASSGLPVTFSVTSGNASISSGNLLTAFDTNPVTVQASQAGNDTYAAAPGVSQTVGATAAGSGLSSGQSPQVIGQTAGTSATGAPQIQPSSLAVNAGASATLSVSAAGATAYQWQCDGADIAGATGSILSIQNIGTYQAGSYTVAVTTSDGTVVSSAVTVAVNDDARLVNLSARAFVGTDSQVLVAGFAVAGPAPMQLLVRGAGPALSAFGMAGALPGPCLSLFDSSSAVISTNTGWGNASVAGPSTGYATIQPASASIFAQVFAFPLATGSADSALVATVPSGGAFTAQVSGVGGTTGVALVELYDMAFGNSGSSLSSLSARAFVGTGSNVTVVGFTLAGTTSETVLLRGIGPTLGQYGISTPLANPQLVLYDSQDQVIASNAGWGNAPQRGSSAVAAGVAPASARIMSLVGAFLLPSDSADCAILVTLPPGTYTAQLSGLDGATGVGLVEAYDLP
jgi:hypothetical protein